MEIIHSKSIYIVVRVCYFTCKYEYYIVHYLLFCKIYLFKKYLCSNCKFREIVYIYKMLYVSKTKQQCIKAA